MGQPMSTTALKTPAESPASTDATVRLAEHVTSTNYDDLPASVIHAYKRAFQDHLTCAIAGSAMPVSRALLDYFAETDTSNIATVIGNGARLSPQNAAFVNGANTHGLDFDDGHTNGSAHPSGAIFPALLAAAQQCGASPREIVLAAVVGYDVMCRIAAAMHPATVRRGWHNTPIAGVFGATAAVSKLLALSTEQVRHAFGLATSFAGGVREYVEEGAEVKRLHPGKAARDGLLCAGFARRGITGPLLAFEGKRGFFNVFAGGEAKWERLVLGMGERYEIEHVYFKPYPCCRHYHAAVDGLVGLRDEHRFGPDQVEHIDIGLYSVGVSGHDHKHADNLLDAQMSAPAAAGLALVEGDLAAHHFLPESLARTEVRRLIDIADTRLDQECESIYPGRRSGFVRVRLNDGRAFERRVLDPKGEGENPMSDADLKRKFLVNCEPVAGKAKCEKLLDLVWRFDSAADTRELFEW